MICHTSNVLINTLRKKYLKLLVKYQIKIYFFKCLKFNFNLDCDLQFLLIIIQAVELLFYFSLMIENIYILYTQIIGLNL